MIVVTQAHLHELLTDARTALVEYRTEQATAILDALRKITVPASALQSAPPPVVAKRAEKRTRKTSSRRQGVRFAVWTDERAALLRERFATCTDDAALLAELNALPGPPVQSAKAITLRAYLLGLKRAPEVTHARKVQAGVATQAILRGANPDAAPKWTAERIALLSAEWPTCLDRADLLARINALPGDPISSLDSMRCYANQKGLRATAETVRIMRREGGKRGGLRREALSAAAEPASEAPIVPAMEPEPVPPAEPVEPPPVAAPPPVAEPVDEPPSPAPGMVRQGDDKREAFDLFDQGATVRAVAQQMDESVSVVGAWHVEWQRKKVAA